MWGICWGLKPNRAPWLWGESGIEYVIVMLRRTIGHISASCSREPIYSVLEEYVNLLRFIKVTHYFKDEWGLQSI